MASGLVRRLVASLRPGPSGTPRPVGDLLAELATERTPVPMSPAAVTHATIVSSGEGLPHALIDTVHGDRIVVPLSEVDWIDFCAFVRAMDDACVSTELARTVGGR